MLLWDAAPPSVSDSGHFRIVCFSGFSMSYHHSMFLACLAFAFLTWHHLVPRKRAAAHRVRALVLLRWQPHCANRELHSCGLSVDHPSSCGCLIPQGLCCAPLDVFRPWLHICCLLFSVLWEGLFIRPEVSGGKK